MKTAHWRSHCSADWPKPVVSWLRTRGSLTVRLQRVHGSFRVQLRKQGCGLVLSDEAGLIGVKAGRHVRLRQVTLWAGGQPRVVAHTAVKWIGSQSDWPFWRHLGTRSLGSVLFRDRTVKRGSLEFARLPERHPLAMQAAKAVKAAKAAKAATAAKAAKAAKAANAANAVKAVQAGHAVGGTPQWFARRAVYWRAPQRTPLAVTEVFLSVDCADRLHTVDGM